MSADKGEQLGQAKIYSAVFDLDEETLVKSFEEIY